MKKILAIDDEITIRKLLQVYLGKHYHVTALTDGLEAIKWMQEGNIPDLIVCDIQMPNMNGYEFVENIRSSGLFQNIPLLMLSGEEESATRIKFYKMRVKNFITKPFNPEELLILIKLILDEEIE